MWWPISQPTHQAMLSTNEIQYSKEHKKIFPKTFQDIKYYHYKHVNNVTEVSYTNKNDYRREFKKC